MGRFSLERIIDKIRTNVLKFINNPKSLIAYLPAIVRGSIYIVWFRLFRKNTRIVFPFLAFAKVKIIGPGTVRIGKGCNVQKNVFRGLTIVTRSDGSEVTIGEKCLLGGLTIRCWDRIDIGARIMTAVSLVQDSFFSNMGDVASRGDNDRILGPKPVTIGSNSWVGMDSIVLGGSRIGNDCVLSAGTWCSGNMTNDYTLVTGNPSRRPMPIEKLLTLKGIE